MNVILYFKFTAANAISRKLTGVKEAASELGWHVQVIKSIPTPDLMRELIDFWHPIGAIADCGAYEDSIDYSPLKQLPSVLIDPAPTPATRKFCTIRQDSTRTGAYAAKELLLLGYESFAFIHPLEERFWSHEREIGFSQALAKNRFNVSIFRGQTGGKPDPTRYLRQLKEFITQLPTPCAVFVANDITALEVIGTISTLGLRIPEDIALLSVDNHVEICESTTPSLSSIQPDFRHCGHSAALMLKKLIESPNAPHAHELFNVECLVARQSTRLTRGMSEGLTAALEKIRREACTGLMARDVIKLFPCARPVAEAKFRKAVGHSILEEIQNVRLEKAYELLRNPLISMQSISDFCGFKNPNSLCRFFRQKTGLTMSEWRKSGSSRSSPKNR